MTIPFPPRPRSQNKFMYLIIFNHRSFHQQWNSSLSLQFNSVSQFLQYIHAHIKLTISVACESSFNIHRTIILWNMIRFRPIPKRRTTIFPVIDRFMVCKKWQFMGCSIPHRWRDMGTYKSPYKYYGLIRIVKWVDGIFLKGGNQNMEKWHWAPEILLLSSSLRLNSSACNKCFMEEIQFHINYLGAMLNGSICCCSMGLLLHNIPRRYKSIQRPAKTNHTHLLLFIPYPMQSRSQYFSIMVMDWKHVLQSIQGLNSLSRMSPNETTRSVIKHSLSKSMRWRLQSQTGWKIFD